MGLFGPREALTWSPFVLRCVAGLQGLPWYHSQIPGGGRQPFPLTTLPYLLRTGQSSDVQRQRVKSVLLSTVVLYELIDIKCGSLLPSFGGNLSY